MQLAHDQPRNFGHPRRRHTRGAQEYLAAVLFQRAAEPAARACAQSGLLPRAKSAAAYIVAVEAQIPLLTMARALGRDRIGLRRAVRGIEELREQPVFDAAIAAVSQEVLA